MARKPTLSETSEARSEEVSVTPTKSPKFKVVALSHFGLYEPEQHIRFPKDIPVEVYEITSWMRCQIAAGLMKEV